MHRPRWASPSSAVASDSRSPHANRAPAFVRLVEKLEQQRARHSPGTKREILENKRHRGETKKMRGRVGE